MSTPALLSIQQRLSSTSSLLLERSRVISLKLPPSASSQNQIVRNLTSIKNDLSKLETEYQVVASTPGKKGGKTKEGELTRQLREVGESFDRLVEIFGEDDVGREKAKVLRRQINK
jgi:syntaxin 8